MLSHSELLQATNPDDPDGWLMLTNSYAALERYPDALRAVENLYRLKSNDPSVILRYADILSMVNNGAFKGKPTKLINEALELDPTNNSGLWLSGLAAIQRGELQNAINTWERLVTQFDNGSESRQQIQHYIDLARGQLIEETPSTEQTEVNTVGIKVNVRIADALLNEVNSDDEVFIFATSIGSPPIPLAILRKQVSDLPADIILVDSMAMTPTNKLSQHKQVKLIAQISKNNNSKQEPGDLEGIVHTAQTNIAKPITLLIDRQIK